MTSRLISRLAGLILLLPFSAAALEFKDLPQLVESKNEKVLAKASELKAAQKREGYFTRTLLPVIEAGAALENFKVGSQEFKSQPAYGAEARVNLFNGGRDKIRSEKLSLTAKRREQEKRLVLAEELDRARELYWTLLFQRDLIELVKESRGLNLENLKAADRRIRGGVATQSDRVEFEMKDVDLKRDQTNAEVQMTALKQRLAVLIGADHAEKLTVTETLSHQHDWESEIKHDHSDHEFLFKPGEILSEESELAAKESRRSWLPKLDAFVGYNQYNQREESAADSAERRETVFGVRLTMSLLDGLNSVTEASAQGYEASAAKFSSVYQRREVEAHIESELSELKALHGQVHEAEENIERAKKYYNLTKSEYSRGAKNSPDMLGASEKLFEMKKKKIEIVRDFQISRSHLLSKTGK